MQEAEPLRPLPTADNTGSGICWRALCNTRFGSVMLLGSLKAVAMCCSSQASFAGVVCTSKKLSAWRDSCPSKAEPVC